MPTIEVLFNDLQRLVGTQLPMDKEALTDLLAYVKGEVESLSGNELSIELKDGNRPDLWSVEGIARGLRGALGIELGLRKYEVSGPSGVEIFVEPQLKSIRPFIGCAVVKSVQLDNETIREFMHLQDKLDQTYGRRRRRASIGFYNFDLIKPPIYYKAASPQDYRFVPLDGSEAMTLKEILDRHPKGIEYGPIVRPYPLWPILVDSYDRVLSFPPIINSNDLGKIIEGQRDILVEVTGTNYQTVRNTVTLVTLSLADRGKEILTAKIHYPYGSTQDDVVPILETKTVNLSPEYVNSIIGLRLKPSHISELLLRARYDAKVETDQIEVTVPCYRMDIMHLVDIIEDVAIAYGFNNISPSWPRLATTGSVSQLEESSDKVRELMLGLGYQETLTFCLTNPENQKEKMNLKSLGLVEVANPMTLHFTCLRSWLIPSLLEVLANNTHAMYPQRIFEVGDCATFNEKKTGIREIRKLAGLTAYPLANFNEAKGIVEALFRTIGIQFELFDTNHPSFTPGRVGSITIEDLEIGVVGELHPKILTQWGLMNPVAGFEVDLNTVFENLPAKAESSRV